MCALNYLARILTSLEPRQLPAARDTMVLCAQEMNHLAGILPAVYAAFGGERQTGP